jgi:hypothetical protein
VPLPSGLKRQCDRTLGAFRWGRDVPTRAIEPTTLEEEENAYVELLSDEARELHATALSNYAAAAIASLRLVHGPPRAD